MTIQKPHRSSWSKKMNAKQELKAIREHESKLKEEKKQTKLVRLY